ncbi:MAG: KpsF/GutQ family sugar-phosphate isomerase [Lewinellaceae bacterium]|nr:KpsF/GutQ family sugar-phosphate isomerase [Lewinellaceae bacterium]
MNTEDLILKTATRTIEIEAETIRGLLPGLNSDFVNTVQIIFAAKGRVVVTGIGKSALIAQKIVATLNSTGTPALFLHAADAIHGDLGMIRSQDVVICLSKSGETPEIKVLVPLVKNMGNTLIGMVSTVNSFLGRQANYVLLTPIEQEADPNNLAPTASTTAQVVMGDALATALLALRGFTPSDFAQYHPGGSLGKQLYLRVSDLYTLNEKPCVSPDDSLRQAILEMTSKRLGATAVVDDQRKIVGVITDGDLRRMLEQSTPDIHALKARDVMTPNPKTIDAEAMAVNALQLMRKHSITQILVANAAGEYLGIVHLHDLIREGLI